jgi:hypothetical protein
MRSSELSVVELICKALADEVSINEATKRLSQCTKSTALLEKNALHLLVHFVTDADIRLKDVGYDASQRDQLCAMVDKLRFAGLK